MLYFNDRNSRIAEMTIEIAQSSKQLKEKREKICDDLELAIKNRMIRKWSILKTSTDKQSLESFLSELTGMKSAMILRHQQVIGVLEKVQRRVHSSKMACSGVTDCNDGFDVSAIGSQRYNYLLQDDEADVAATSKVIIDADCWDMMDESSSRGTFHQDAISVIIV
ncbi:uncharacterized protein LOC132951383 [Metopolophium dirhodum]|uniref:uncharacterized protein LOC132951383 n=1 Tax=Metopolophium dirhodum TaxID=44670 RepID=UPI00298FB27E|nr:uncharacterized protein LOC132951383 [Metopolophium dirhodum]